MFYHSTLDPWARECVVCGPGQVECWQSVEKWKVEKSVSSLLALGLDDGHFLFLIARYQCNANSKHVDVTGSQSDNSLIQLVEIEPIRASDWSASWWPLIGLMITFLSKWISVIVSTFHWPLLTQDSWDTAWAPLLTVPMGLRSQAAFSSLGRVNMTNNRWRVICLLCCPGESV